jgi:integrase
MSQTKPSAKTNPFVDPDQSTMADLVAVISADTELDDTRRRNVTSSIRRFCATLGYELTEVPANHGYFRERLKRFHPLAAGIKKKRWQTIKSDVSFAFKQAGITKGQARSLAPHSPEWRTLKDKLSSDYFNWGLSRLARFCSAQGIPPQEVDDGVIEAYDRAVRRESFKENPDRHLREVCRLWNKAVDLLSDLGLRKVKLPSRRENYTSPWQTLPAAFTEDADAWLESMSKEADLLSDEGPIKPLRPASIKAYRFAIRQIFAALVHKGWAPEAIDSLNALVQADNAKSALQFFLERNGEKTSPMIANIAHVLVLIATAGGRADQATTDKLKRYRKQLAVRSTGLRPRPRNALRPFVDVANVEKILTLPLRIHERLRRKTELTPKDARLMQVAVALELLLMRPIRRKNLVELRLNEHIVRSGRNTFIVIEPDAVKNEIELDYRIPPESAGLLDFYVKRLLPLLGSNPSGWLFPGAQPERHKSGEQFARQFVKTIKEATGLHFYPHLARHFGAFLYLGEKPGAFEVVRRVLAHKSLATTTRSYSSFDDEAAVRLFDTLILRIRDTIRREVIDD